MQPCPGTRICELSSGSCANPISCVLMIWLFRGCVWLFRGYEGGVTVRQKVLTMVATLGFATA
jgi:hypothetical protein